MPNQVTKFLRRIATACNLDVYDSVSGEIFIGAQQPITQSSGAIYGIWAEIPCVSTSPKPIPGYKNWFPVYWGKDIAPVSRLKAHVQGHKKNGNINLPAQPALKGKKLIYGSIWVSQYQSFEQLLHQRYQPLLGTNRVGSKGKLIKVVN